MDKETARLRIVRDTRQAEDALNLALLKNSQLFTTLVEARTETGSGSFLGHEELLRLAQGQRSLLSAAGGLARVHGGLRKIQSDETSYDDCPELNPPKGRGDEPARLRA